MKKITLLLLLCFNFAGAQNFEKSYRGWWGETMWEFNFHNNGSFNRISAGHYGATDVKGEYSRKGDTLTILKGHKNSNATIAKKYFLDIDGKLIDTYLHVEYSEIPVPDTVTTFYEIERKLQKIVISDTNGVIKDTLIYYGADPFDIQKDMKQLYYFLNYSNLLPMAGNVILTKRPEDGKLHLKEEAAGYDNANRLADHVYSGSRLTSMPPNEYIFEYSDEYSYKLKSITDHLGAKAMHKFTFEYDEQNNIKKVIETGEDYVVRWIYTFL